MIGGGNQVCLVIVSTSTAYKCTAPGNSFVQPVLTDLFNNVDIDAQLSIATTL